MWLHEVLARARENRGKNRAASARYVRPEIEELTPRIVPSTDQWIGPAGGLWNVPANWSLGRTPQSTDMLITGSTTSTDNIPSLTVVSWTNTGSVVTIAAGNTVKGQQYVSDKGGLILGAGSTVASDNFIYEYATVTATIGAMGAPTATMSSPTVILEPGSTVTATGGTTAMPALKIQGTVEQYGTLSVGTATAPGTVTISGAYTINNTAKTTINAGGTLTYSGTTPLQDQGILDMLGATLDLNGNTVNVDDLLDSEAPGDTIKGTVDVTGGTLAADAVFHTLTIPRRFKSRPCLPCCLGQLGPLSHPVAALRETSAHSTCLRDSPGLILL